MRETWAALVSRSSYGNCKQTQWGLASEGKEEGAGSRPTKVLGAVCSPRDRPGARLHRAWVGKKRPSKLDVPAGLTGQGGMGVVS